MFARKGEFFPVCRGFHAACHIHGIAPEVVGEWDFPDDACHNRRGVNADTHSKLGAVFLVDALKCLDHLDCGVCHRMGVVMAVVGGGPTIMSQSPIVWIPVLEGLSLG